MTRDLRPSLCGGVSPPPVRRPSQRKRLDSPNREGPSRDAPIRYAVFYLLVAGAWILFSDRALSAMAPDLASIDLLPDAEGAVLRRLDRGDPLRPAATAPGEPRRGGRLAPALGGLHARGCGTAAAARPAPRTWGCGTGTCAANHVYYSPEWKRQIGYEVDEIDDGFEEWRGAVHPEDARRPRGGVRLSWRRATPTSSRSSASGTATAATARSSPRHRSSATPRARRAHAGLSHRRHRAQAGGADASPSRDGARSRARGGRPRVLEQGSSERSAASGRPREDPLRLRPRSGRVRATCWPVVHPEDRQRFAREFAEVTDPEGSGRIATEYRVVHPDGSVRWLAVHVRVVHEGEGGAAGGPRWPSAPARTSPIASAPSTRCARARSGSASRRRWRPSASSPAAWPTTSTTCWS